MSARDPMQDPRVGDVVQVHPPFGRSPAELIVTAVTDERVYWTRRGRPYSTDRRTWSGESRYADQGRSMSLVGGQP